jgi:hypothetical protein
LLVGVILDPDHVETELVGQPHLLEHTRPVGCIRNDKDTEFDRYAAIIAWMPAQPISRLTPAAISLCGDRVWTA